MSRIIAIVGATGNQGGSVARSLLQNPSFKVRAITRDPSSKASQTLASAGAEVVQANGFNNEEMLRAFDGAWGFYVNLNSDDKIWSNPDGPTEFDLGKSIVDAAAQAGVKHFVFSSGPPCTEMTEGKVRMKAMDMKYKIEQYAKQLGKFSTITPINAAWYLENFLVKEVAPVFGGFPHFPDDEGYLTYRVPNWGGDNKVPFLSITDDYGDIVQGIFLDPVRWNGHVVQAMSDMLGFDELVANFADLTGKKTRFQPILPSWEAFETHGVHELEDVKLMFGFTQITGGRYFGPEPSKRETASELKRATATALGRPEDQRELMTAKDWFKSHFL
ncbi:putative NmrA family transcriptional regulator [Trichophyton interdigitale]|uniref:NmrA family transcriptional regulator n=1 Tax=Trichophyton interdigitale TaxID=101480 RepID=A0A9P4YMM4_9EURO|nr:putative NmrA family transcriptional regulator [Trichophyton interdigitale]KAF3900054.1 putative NmrA family transcriptional regulator [Trichophyton interdigitale]KAG8211145.1 putative NmrA family transcriptional regulator [Trichophyton interdigitale]